MTTFWQVLVIFLHTLAAWIGVEVYVNSFHTLARIPFVALHYLVVFIMFSLSFAIHAKFFPSFSVFATTVIGTAGILCIEVVVFRYLYTGDLWFFTYIDWIVPIFLAASAIYFAEYFVRV